MQVNLRRLLYVAVSWLWVLSVAILPAQGELLLELNVPQEEYVIDEPLYVVVTFHNTGESGATILRYLDPGVGLLTFELTAVGESARQYKPWVNFSYSREALAKGAVYICPGEMYTGVVDLTHDGGIDKTTLSRFGEHVIQAKYQIFEDLPYGPMSLLSNAIRIKVMQPTDIDLGAHDTLLEGSQVVKFGFWNANTGQGEYYRTLIRDYPESKYAVHAKFYLAQVYESDGEERLRGVEERRKDLGDAAALFASVSNEAAQTPLAHIIHDYRQPALLLGKSVLKWAGCAAKVRVAGGARALWSA